MRPRHRGDNLGLLLLFCQIFQVGFNNVPPATLVTLALNIYLFLFPLKNLMQVCISVQNVYFHKDWSRILLAQFHHADDWHLYFNMASFLWKGLRLEGRLGSMWFAYLLGVFSLLTGVVYILLEMALSELLNDASYNSHCAVGFSGVLFALKVVNSHYYPGGVIYIMGFPVANRYTCWVELIAIHLLSPGTSFEGHLAGILVGLMYTKGPLKKIMKLCSGIFSSDHHHYSRPQYFSSSGRSGYRTNPYNAYERQPPMHYEYNPYNQHPGFDAYTGGFSEQEQYEAAIRASLNDRGHPSQGSPPYGFNIQGEPLSYDEMRQRRLNRFNT
ncbi:rhomboid-related protein 4 [Erpetoichthys calabaricus]|uniref:rhomboid-related protein 4 n=1 Tax=Erpetoichthys calabaricus TaxID=27687 RepID=UPI0022347667|nr:rhomboid-related protein 4 [Erpetoichthys calabaricus]XP_051778992.1 rhomboid-related protein 4 [Erpetoichthys calabaricus]